MTDLGDEQKLARQRITSMIAGGLKPKLVPLHKVQDGINAVRVTLPVCRFDKEKTKKGRESLVEYRKEYDEKKRVFKTTPLHNWASHDADSFRGLCMAWKNQIIPPAEKPKPPPVKTIGHHTMDELWKMQKPKKERV
jgi:hypothetical protein